MFEYLEAVPNFSEGRDLAKVRALVDAIDRPGVEVLDWSADPDHHRSVITFIGADFGSLLGGAIVTERIFNIPGVGGFLFTGIHNHDGVSVVGTVTMLVLVFLLVNLLVDLLYGVLDPRISHD